MRERKILKGMSGVVARAWRMRNPSISSTASAPSASVCAEPHAWWLAWTIVYTASISELTKSSAPGASAPCPSPIPFSAGSSRIASTAVVIPIGALTKKIQCQLSAWVSTPPASSPIAPPKAATKL